MNGHRRRTFPGPVSALTLALLGTMALPVLAEEGGNTAEVAATSAPEPRLQPTHASAWRDGLRQALREGREALSEPSGSQAVQHAAGELLQWFEGLEQSGEGLSPSERRYWQRLVSQRLAQLAVVLRQPPAETEDPAEQPAAPATLVAPVAPLAQVGVGVGVGAAATPTGDYGPRLAEVIERTIAPESWQRVGGQGVIVYWPAQRAMVVRQTSGGHEQLGRILGQMRP